MQLYCFPQHQQFSLYAVFALPALSSFVVEIWRVSIPSTQLGTARVKDCGVTQYTDTYQIARGEYAQSAAAVKKYIMTGEFDSLHLNVCCHAL